MPPGDVHRAARGLGEQPVVVEHDLGPADSHRSENPVRELGHHLRRGHPGQRHRITHPPTILTRLCRWIDIHTLWTYVRLMSDHSVSEQRPAGCPGGHAYVG